MKKILLIFILGMFLISFASASLDSLVTFKQNQCVNISQTCASCSYVNISSISNSNNSNLVSNVAMTYFGNGEWRYEFCNTSYLGRYDVRGVGDINGVDETFATYFYVKSSNDFVFLLILILAFVFFGLALLTKLPPLGFISSLLFTLGGVYLMIYGFNGAKDLYVHAAAISIIGIGFIFMMLSAYEWLTEEG